jgi:hypothetical protein
MQADCFAFLALPRPWRKIALRGSALRPAENQAAKIFLNFNSTIARNACALGVNCCAGPHPGMDGAA